MKPAQPSLRIALPRDLPALLALDQVCFPEPFAFGLATMRSEAFSPGAETWIAQAVNTEEIAGFAIWRTEETLPAQSSYLVTLDVAPASQRRGLGSSLLALWEQRAGMAGAATGYLHVWAGNTAAIRLYRSADFQRVDRHPDFYGSGLHAFVYPKQFGR